VFENVGDMGSNFQEPIFGIVTIKLKGIVGTWDNMGVDDFSKLLEQLTSSCVCVCVCVCVCGVHERELHKETNFLTQNSQPKYEGSNAFQICQKDFDIL
jgi:hypothetical protein